MKWIRSFFRGKVVTGLCAVVMIFCFLEVAKDIGRYFTLKQDMRNAETEITQLEEKKAALELNKEKLSNPDYLEHYVRGKYLVSKEGEMIFKFPPLEENQE